MDSFFEKHSKLRFFLICFAILLFVFIAEVMYFHNFYNTLNYNGQEFRVRAVDAQGISLVDRDGNAMSVQGYDSGYRKGSRRMSYLSEVVLLEYVSWGSDSVYTFSDGSSQRVAGFSQRSPYSIQSENTSWTELQESEKRFMEMISDYYTSYLSRDFFVLLTVIGSILLLSSCVTFFYPEKCWRINTFFTVRNGEPTDFYFDMSRLGSVITIAIVYIGIPTIVYSM